MSITPRILIVDDEPLMTRSLQDLLGGMDYDVRTAATGSEGIGRLSEETFDLVLLDIGLPDMDGFQVMDHLARNSPGTRVVIITGHATIESALEAIRRGAYNYLRKPFQYEELITTVGNALEHKRLEKERRRAEEALREVVENSLVGISIIQDDRIVFQNPEQKKIFGPLPWLLARGELDFIHPEDREKVRGFHKGLVSRKAPVLETDFRFFPSDKASGRAEMRWVQCRASFFTYRGEEAILVNTVDVTRAKELEHLVTIKDKMMSLGRVAAGIAHEIRNPLTGINTYLYSLENLCGQEGPDPESLPLMKQIIGQIQLASNKIESVIKRVLDFSKPSVPRMRLTDINAPIREAVNLSAVTLRKGGVHLETSLLDPLPRCFADPHLIEQVILNLINNAYKAMEQQEGPRHLGIATSVEGECIRIDISDAGPGVPPGLREEIFDPFFTTNTDGSGIGLSLVQRIITDHNGSVTVGESRWGGALFRIELPIERRKNPR